MKFRKKPVTVGLALAAATAQDRLGIDDRAAWSEVTS